MTAILEASTAQDSDAPATPVFAALIRHPSAWRVADFRGRSVFHQQLHDPACALGFRRRRRAGGRASSLVAALARRANPARASLHP